MSVERYHYKDHVILAEIDPDPMNSRKEFDNAGTMVCWHSRYDLGDKHDWSSAEDFLKGLACEVDPSVDTRIDWWENTGFVNHSSEFVDEKVKEIIQKALDKHVIMLECYLYDHSGITMNTSGFSCDWDSGQVGFIYISRKNAVKEWGKKLCTKKVVELAKKYLKGEVETYDQYLTGQVYGKRVLGPLEAGHTDEDDDPKDEEWDDEREEIDSCWGYFGSDMTDEDGDMVKEAKSTIDWHIKDNEEKAIQEAVAVSSNGAGI